MLKALIMLETWAVPSFSTLNMETAGLTTDRYRFVVLGALLALALLCVAGCAGTNGESSRAIDDNAALPPPVRPVKPVEPRPFPEGPRKVVLGTTIFSVFRPWSGLEHRLEEIAQRVDLMAEDARKRYGRGLDLAVFPENAVNPRDGDSLLERAVELDGPVSEMLGAKAREHGTYLVVSFNMIEDRAREHVSNVAVLFDREGEVAGIYRKVFLVASNDSERLEGGKAPGEEFPVFDTDFGRIAMLICYDLGYDDVFEAYAAQGAELVAWPTMSPQTFPPRCYAYRFGLYIVSSTPRDNASIFDPAGRIAATVTQTGGVVTHEIDLDYRTMIWQPGLDEGRALSRAYGDRAGFHYSQREDMGIFWSNDPDKPIGEMIEELEFLTQDELRARTRILRERELERRRAAE